MVKDKDIEALVLDSYKDLSSKEAYNIVKERYGDRLPIISSDVKYRILAISILESDKKTMQDIKSRVTSPIQREIRQAKRDNDLELMEVLEKLVKEINQILDSALSDMDLSKYNENLTLDELLGRLV